MIERESCPVCGCDEWEMKDANLNYGMSIYICTKCGFGVIE